MRKQTARNIEATRKGLKSRTRYRVTVLLFLIFLALLSIYEHTTFPETAAQTDQVLLVILVFTISFLWMKEREQQVELQMMVEQVLETEQQLEDHALRTMEALVLALEAKDPESRGHSREVARLAAAIGRQMKFSNEQIDTIIHSALLHDLGKLGVDDDILGKTGKLTPREYGLVKDHTVTGSDILSALSFMKKEQAIIRYHHERYDGTGYPDGLVREEIPIEARVLAAADAFAVITAGRVYQEAADCQEALERIRLESGRQFDPLVVEAVGRAVGDGLMLPARRPVAGLDGK